MRISFSLYNYIKRHVSFLIYQDGSTWEFVSAGNNKVCGTVLRNQVTNSFTETILTRNSSERKFCIAIPSCDLERSLGNTGSVVNNNKCYCESKVTTSSPAHVQDSMNRLQQSLARSSNGWLYMWVYRKHTYAELSVKFWSVSLTSADSPSAK